MSGEAVFLAGSFGMLAGLAYVVLTVLILRGYVRPPAPLLSVVITAMVVSTVTGFVTAFWATGVARPAAFLEALLWTSLLAFAAGILRDRAAQVVTAVALLLTLAIAKVAPADPWLMAMAATSIIGLFLVSGLAGSDGPYATAGYRLLLLALGIGFTFDIGLAAVALASDALLQPIETVRPLLRALLAPLLALGLATLPRYGGTTELTPVARRFVLVAGCTAVALLATAAAATLLGSLAGAVLGCALFLPLMLAILTSAAMPGAGQWLDDRLGHYLRTHRYDYRVVWPGFVDILTGADPRPNDDLPERVIRAVAGTVGAAGGGIWINDGDDRYRRLAVCALPPEQCGSGSAPGLAAALLAADQRHDGLTHAQPGGAGMGQGGPLPDGIAWPDFLPPLQTIWLVLPLIHKEALFGFLALRNPLQPRALDHEDHELLRLVSRQATSYLAEDEAARQLTNARQYENFTRRFAYVMHDVKNVAAELSLTHANAKRHRGNQAFYDDMVETLEFSVDRMNRLITQLRQERHPRVARVPLAALLRRVAARRTDPRVVLAEPLTTLAARVEEEALETALEHLVDNALEAIGPTGKVTLGLERQGRMAALVITDDGPGLPPEILHKAVRAMAFTSQKPGGLGLGLDQARNTVERVGGRFDLRSMPGQGTTIVLCLPELPSGVSLASLQEPAT